MVVYCLQRTANTLQKTKGGKGDGSIYWVHAPADNRVLEANTQRLRLSQALCYLVIADKGWK